MTYPADFLTFWAVYPRRQPNPKKEAFAEWRKAILKADPEVITAGAAAYGKWVERENSGWLYHARRFLHGEMWNDYLDHEAEYQAGRVRVKESILTHRAIMIKRGHRIPSWTDEDVLALLDEGLITVEHARAVGVEVRQNLKVVG